MPFDAIAVRTEPFGATSVYLCRAYHNNDVQPGFTTKGDYLCHFSYGGKELTSGNYDYWTPTWVTDRGQAMPTNAIAFGGEHNAYRYICRQGWQPGEYGADLGGCTYPYGGIEYGSTQGFQWLVDSNNNAGWGPGTSPNNPIRFEFRFGPYRTDYTNVVFPQDAIVAGIDSDEALLYLCTAFYQDGFQPGKTKAGWNACDIGWGGAEHYVTDNYFVLVPNYAYFNGYGLSDGTTECQVDSGNGQCKLNPLPVGQDTDGSILYSCVGVDAYENYHLGKTKLAWNACSYANNGVESYSVNGYSILIDGVIFPPGYKSP